MKKKSLLFLTLIVLFGYNKEATAAAATQLWDEFPLVRDNRNFKESKGGKAIPSQGRIIDESLRAHMLNEQAMASYTPQRDKNWRYVVALNCCRGGRSVVEIIREIEGKLLPEDQRDRLAVILGINERVTLDNPLDYGPANLADTVGGEDVVRDLQTLKIPILIVYFQWTSFREHRDKSDNYNTAYKIRQAIFDRLDRLGSQRQKEFVRNKLTQDDSSHKFPFGTARQLLLQNASSQKFLTGLHQKECLVYTHIQDADFVYFQESLLFNDLQGEEGKRLIPAGQNYLFAKYDALIAHHQTKNGRLPVIVGGAHVYSPEEDLKDYMTGLRTVNLDRTQAKHWTRFTSETGNGIKHLIGQQQPYGLYFHEPNTLVLSPVSAGYLRLRELSREWRLIYSRLEQGFNFGIDSELQDFTRALFKGVSDLGCRQGMVFSATTVLSTSMKRSNKPFTIRFSGEYDPKTKQFIQPTRDDLAAMRGMSQEIITSNDWGSSVATSFKFNKVKGDARKHIYAALKLFDPIEDLNPMNSTSFSNVLIRYGERVQGQQENARELFHNLRGYYEKQKQGNFIALQIIAAGWETAYFMRFMFLKHLQPPATVIVPPLSNPDQEIAFFLSQRFNFALDIGNPFVADLLGLTPLAQPLRVEIPLALPAPEAPLEQKVVAPEVAPFNPTKEQIIQVVTYLYTENKKNNSQTARDVGVDARTVPNLISGKAQPASRKKVANSLGTPEKVRQRLGRLPQTKVDYIIGLFAG